MSAMHFGISTRNWSAGVVRPDGEQDVFQEKLAAEAFYSPVFVQSLQFTGQWWSGEEKSHLWHHQSSGKSLDMAMAEERSVGSE